MIVPDWVAALASFVVVLLLFAIIIPPILALLYSERVWSTPPFSWYRKWMDFWVEWPD